MISYEQLAVLGVLVGTMALFLQGRWRHDVVALSALLAAVLLGLVPADNAFAGFGHPAVITVAVVLVLGYGLQHSGAVDWLAQHLLPARAGIVLSQLALVGLAAVLSGFMNNVGALALLMPIALQVARRLALPPGQLLMPLAFGSILGGMTTLIGTPSNLIVSGFRAEAGLGPFALFDFSPVGVAVAATGVLFICLLGWRLVPARSSDDGSDFDFGQYRSEVRVGESSPWVGKPLLELEKLLDEQDAQVVGLVRGEFRVLVPNPQRRLRAGDILILLMAPDSLEEVLADHGLALEEEVSLAAPDDEEREQVAVREYVIMPTSPLINRSASDITLRTRYHINLLALSHRGLRTLRRLRSSPFLGGDVVLLQGTPEALSGFAQANQCLPLAERDIALPSQRRVFTAMAIMATAVGTVALGLLSAPLAFTLGALVMVVSNIVPLRSAYDAIDWPVVVLLAAMLPVAGAMASTGTAALLADWLIQVVAQGQAVWVLVILMLATMILSDLMNNAATAALMCPVALDAAAQLQVNPDAYLMAVAIGASCAFLTPIGHQNNTLILGPGGFRFGDYWRLGLPVQLLVLLVAVPLLLRVWPL